MFDFDKCKKVPIKQGAFYFGEWTDEHTKGYLELEPFTSLEIHNRPKGFENLTQVTNKCVMVLFDKPEGTTHLLDEGDNLKIEPEGAWHIHTNPFDKKSLTYFHFKGDIRDIVDKIVKEGAE